MTARILTGLTAVLLGLPAALCSAQLTPNGQTSSYDRGTTGQTAGPRFEDKRQQADDLLQRAGQLLERDDLDRAEALIRQAEALNPDYPLFYSGPTPAKLRRDLERRMQASGRGGSRNTAAPADPFAAFPGGDPSAAGDPKTVAKQFIRRARQAMERGNLPEAIHDYRKSAEQRAFFGDNEDSPERLAADLRRMGAPLDDGAPGPAARGLTPLPRVDQATMLPPAAAQRPYDAPTGSALAPADPAR